MTKRKATETAVIADPDMVKMKSTALGVMMIDPALSAGMVASSYAAPSFASWEDIGPTNVQDAIELLAETVKSGDLSDVEKMLVSQAVALQTMFSTFAAKAAHMSAGANMAMLTNLALRAQAQSRATLDSLVNLKYPRTTVIAKQANVAASGGMQQVNNVAAPAPAPAHEESRPNKLEAVEVMNGSTTLDAGATRSAGRDHSRDETMVEVDRPTKPGGTRRGR